MLDTVGIRKGYSVVLQQLLQYIVIIFYIQKSLTVYRKWPRSQRGRSVTRSIPTKFPRFTLWTITSNVYCGLFRLTAAPDLKPNLSLIPTERLSNTIKFFEYKCRFKNEIPFFMWNDHTLYQSLERTPFQENNCFNLNVRDLSILKKTF